MFTPPLCSKTFVHYQFLCTKLMISISIRTYLISYEIRFLNNQCLLYFAEMGGFSTRESWQNILRLTFMDLAAIIHVLGQKGGKETVKIDFDENVLF